MTSGVGVGAEADSGSVVDQLGADPAAEDEAPAPVAPGQDLLPPSSSDAPATPPRAD